MGNVDVGKLQDQAARALQKKQYLKAAELYLRLAEAEPGVPDWRQQAGEAYRSVPDAPRAIMQLMLAAEGFARRRLVACGIAACNGVLQLEPAHRSARLLLDDLKAQRGARTRSGRLPLVAPVDLGRTQSGAFRILPHQAPPVVPALTPEAATTALRGTLDPLLGFVDGASVVALDEVPARPLPTTTRPSDPPELPWAPPRLPR
jgi:hypothetical protein